MWAPAAAPAPTRPTAAAAAVIARTSAPTGGLADGDRPALGQVGARGGIGPDHVPLVHRVVGLLLHLAHGVAMDLDVARPDVGTGCGTGADQAHCGRGGGDRAHLSPDRRTGGW